MGYSAHDFAIFLQLLYGILTPEAVQDLDLLPVFRICYLYDVPGLVSVLSQRIFKSLVLSVNTWPSLIRFSENYCLKHLKGQSLEYASRHREIWCLAVEMLDLEDFKIVLRGIRTEDTAVPSSTSIVTQERPQEMIFATTTRAIKDELLMMYLLVHYQNGTSKSSSLTSESTLRRKTSSSSSRMEGIARRLSITCPTARIQRQLHNQQPPPATQKDLVKSDGAMTQHGSSANSAVGLPIRTEKAEKARSWMKQFKRECGWDGQVSHLD